MKSAFSSKWKSSKQPRKQRKYRYNAPKHLQNKFLGCRLSKELKEKYNKRNLTLKKGDKIKIMVGQFKGKTGKVEKILLADSKVYIENIQVTKKDGNKVYYPIHVSNLMLLCPKTGKPTRIGINILESGKRVRFSKKAKESIE